jgi:predicted nucleic acid-binding Zn ribbon protein
MALLIKLLLAHLCGDFILQPDSWVLKKEQKKLRSGKLYIHILVHALLTMVLVWDIQFWLPATLIAVSHGMIDALKIVLQKERTKRLWFMIDQFLHITVILVVWYWWEDPAIVIIPADNTNLLLLVTAVVLLTNPSSVAIKMMISQWTPITIKDSNQSLPDAGKYIGILERLFVLAFIVTAHWEAVGFLLAAKSIFRFGDLKDARDRKLTEYVLIGTLLSFGIAIGVGLLVDVLL